MPELSIFREWAPQAYGIWTLVLIAVLYFAREWRETRKLSSADRLARREGYALQVENLQNENRFLTRDLRDLRIEYDEYRRICQEENEQRLREIRSLSDKVLGLERKLMAQSAALPRIIDQKLLDNGG